MITNPEWLKSKEKPYFMIDSLSKGVNLRVNTYPIILNKRLNESELNQHNFKEADFADYPMPYPREDDVFIAKNCVLNYINDDYKNTIAPILDPKDGSHLMYETEAYLWFNNNSLVQFLFKVLNNEYAAKLSIGKLESKLINILGMPLLYTGNPFVITGGVVWKVENEQIVLELPHNEQGGCIALWFINEDKALISTNAQEQWEEWGMTSQLFTTKYPDIEYIIYKI